MKIHSKLIVYYLLNPAGVQVFQDNISSYKC